MSFSMWLLVLGSLLLILGLASAYLRLLPVTTSALYLLFGFAIGPLGLGIWQQDLADVASWLEHLTEAAVLLSLFIGGLKLRLPLRAVEWRAAWLLAGPVLVGTIIGLTLLGHYLLGLDWGVALLVAAILSPTDPVLASLVQVSHASDEDPLRYAISGEAGLNDGIAFPFVIAGLLVIGFEHQWPAHPAQETFDWLLHYVLWAIPAGLLLGYSLGHGVGRLVIHLRARQTDTSISANDFLALALIALSYVGAESIEGLGFLATFAAGLGLRHAEVAASQGHDEPAETRAHSAAPREEGQVHAIVEFGEDKAEHPKVAAGALMMDILSFGGLLERILEVLLVTLLGALLYQHWDWRAVPLGLGLFCVVRPLMALLLIGGTLISPKQRLLLGWFGVRGIGSLYYLSYALNQDLAAGVASTTSDLVLSVVAMSIVLHGLTTQPLLDRYERLKRHPQANDTRAENDQARR
ncbi:MAG: sodium:proton antiporter [Pseudomonas sp.]